MPNSHAHNVWLAVGRTEPDYTEPCVPDPSPSLLPARRGLYELGQYSFLGVYKGSKGLTFSKFSDKGCGMSAVLIILTLEWFLFMGLAYYLEQVLSSGGGRGGRGGVHVSAAAGEGTPVLVVGHMCRAGIEGFSRHLGGF